MLVDRDEALERIFKSTPLPLMAHCEDTAIINKNMEEAKKGYGEDPDVRLHSLIRSEEACLVSTTKAVNLAKKYKARLHVAHVTTAEELELFTPNQTDITAEVCVGHLFFSMLDYAQLGTRIKVNPSIKSPVDQFMLRQSLSDGRIAVVGTDHAPHLLKQKEGGCAKAASGMPMIQFSLVAMLELVDQHVLTIERMVELMAHNPARLFEVRNRGFIRKGAQADLVLVRPNSPWTVTPDVIESKCGWSPLEGHTFQWRVEKTLCNGHLIYNNGQVDRSYIGQPIAFR
jgi:dihydroorotase